MGLEEKNCLPRNLILLLTYVKNELLGRFKLDIFSPNIYLTGSLTFVIMLFKIYNSLLDITPNFNFAKSD